MEPPETNPDAPPTYYDIWLFARLQIVEFAYLLDDMLGIGTIPEFAYLLDELPTPALPSVV